MSDSVVVIASRIRLLEAARDFGLTPLQVCTPKGPEPAAVELCAETVSTDLFDEDGVVAVVEELYERYRPLRVLTLSEDGLLPSARVNERHGLGGNSVESTRLLKDKWAMRRRLAEVGLSPVRARMVTSADELRAFVAELGGPAIVKPLDAGGSKGIAAVREPDDAEPVWQDVLADGRDRMLAEEYLEGPEVSVEAFSVDGKHVVVALTDKVLGPRYIETGHVVPATVSPDLRDDLADLTVALLDAVDLVEGASHTEFKLTPSGPRVVESHNRIGGDNITDLVNNVYGVDFERMTVGVPLGLMRWDGQVPPATRGSAIRFFTPPPGIVRAVSVPDDVPDGVTMSVTVEAGSRIPELRWSPDRVAGHVTSVAESGPAALAACERVVDATRFDVDPVGADAAESAADRRGPTRTDVENR